MNDYHIVHPPSILFYIHAPCPPLNSLDASWQSCSLRWPERVAAYRFESAGERWAGRATRMMDGWRLGSQVRQSSWAGGRGRAGELSEAGAGCWSSWALLLWWWSRGSCPRGRPGSPKGRRPGMRRWLEGGAPNWGYFSLTLRGAEGH